MGGFSLKASVLSGPAPHLSPRALIFKAVRHVATAVGLLCCIRGAERRSKVRVSHKHDLGLKHTHPTT